MFRITVEDSFAAGHALRGYRGKCENVHGHNYKVRVTLEGAELNSIGLLYDFKDLKEAIHCAIRKLDHQFLNDVPPFDVLNPSAENIARYFYDEVGRMVAERPRRVLALEDGGLGQHLAQEQDALAPESGDDELHRRHRYARSFWPSVTNSPRGNTGSMFASSQRTASIGCRPHVTGHVDRISTSENPLPSS